MTTQRKTKRKLSDISFEKEGAHIALVSKDQGGPANGADYALVMKANNFSEEFIQKMQQVRVTMELPDFLRKFFGLYYEDAEVLARMMGYVEPEVETEEVEDYWEDYVQSRLESFEVLKSAYETESIADVISKLDENEYLAMLKDQEKLEKVFRKIEKAKKESAKETPKVSVADSSTETTLVENNEVEPSGSEVNTKLEKSTMTQEVKTATQEVTVEMVEKSALESVQKALDEQKVALEKAMQTIAQFEAEKKAAIEKSRKEALEQIVQKKEISEVLFKAVKDSEETDFQAVLKALSEITVAVEKSNLFQEQGASVDTEVTKESSVAKLIKAKLQPK